MSASPSSRADTSTDGVEQHLLSLGAASHFCASCYADKGLQRCGGCKLVYYCGLECQRANWANHSVLCNNATFKRDWVPAFVRFLTDFAGETEIAPSTRKAMIGALSLLEPWAKGIIASHGLLPFMVELVQKEKYSNYNFSLVALVDVLRQPNDDAIDLDMCTLLLCTTRGLTTIIEILARDAKKLNAAQKLSTLRLLRLTTAHPKLQTIVREELPHLLPNISLAVSNAQTIDVASEFGIILCSLLYSADTPDEHYHMQQNYVKSLNMKLWMNCAFGDSTWAADFDMGATELILALLIDVDLFPDYPAHLRYNIINEVLMRHEGLLQRVIYGFFDMMTIPRDVFQGAALHALAILFSHSNVLQEIMVNLWLMSDLDDDGEELGEDSPLREMLKLFQAEPIVQLNFFKTHMHSNILNILIATLSSPYCNTNFVEAAVGSNYLTDQLEYLEQRYRGALRQAEKWKQTHGVLIRGNRVGNESELENVLSLVSDVKRLLSNVSQDIVLPVTSTE